MKLGYHKFFHSSFTVAADYVPIDTTLSPYNDDTRAHCFAVTIIDDPFPERTEMFFINFVPTLDSVRIMPSRVSVTILDNDCKWKSCTTACN